MSNVIRTDVDALNAVLTLTLPKEDYLPKVNSEIKKYSQKAAMKGFRPGKTPHTLVKKMYGQQFLMDAVNDLMQSKLQEYLEAERLELLGQPLAAADQPGAKLDTKNPQDLSFNFDVAFVPQFEVMGLTGAAYERYQIQVAEATVTDELEAMRKKSGGETEVDDFITAGDIAVMDVKEIGGSIEKELMISMDWLTDDMKSVFSTQKKGDALEFNIFQLEKDTTPIYVRKYFLGLEDSDDRQVNENFSAVIKSVKRNAPAQLNAEFFEKAFGPSVTNETEARAEINKMMSANYENQADALLLRDLQDKMIAENQFQLPDAFMKRWLLTQGERNTPEIIESQYRGFADNLRWTLVRSKIMKAANVEVKSEDLREHYSNKIRGYFGGQPVPEDMLDNLVERVMKDEKQFNELYEEVMTEKVFDAMKAQVTIVNKPISVDEFNSVLAAARFEAAKARGEVTEELGVES